MTPKEKANDILDSFWLMDKVEPMLNEVQAKQCTLICIDEIIRTLLEDIKDIDVRGNILLNLIEYWQEVKTKI